MSLTTLACVGTVLVGCYIFLFLTGKQQEIEDKDRMIRRWTEVQESQKNQDSNSTGIPLDGAMAESYTAGVKDMIGSDN